VTKIAYPREDMGPKDATPRLRFSLLYYFWGIALFLLLDSLIFSSQRPPAIAYSEFLHRVISGQVASVVITGDHIYGEMKPPSSATGTKPAPPASVPRARTPWRLRLDRWLAPVTSRIETAERAAAEQARRSFTVLPLRDDDLLKTLEEHGVSFRAEIESHWLHDFLDNWLLPIGIMIIIWAVIMRRMGQGVGMLNVGKSKAKIYEADPKTLVHFDDVAGVDEAVEETKEIVSFLKEPRRYTALGAKLPKGVLLVGPPGTGKTLLARAVAGEASVPFFNLSGSDFVEMFVGVGAARVRDLFAEAKRKAPCIIFIDELDAIGKSRAGQGVAMGGYDERENTLNQILVEMDGFDGSIGVVIMAATNRPEVLDRALLRPGRFDRQVLVDRPAREGRLAIFLVHTRKLALDDSVDLERLAAETPGFVGADIANLCNEAAILGSRLGHPRITMTDFQEALERIIGGLEKKSSIVSAFERRIVAYHESGHTLIGYFTPGADPVQKVSIVPRGRGALGYTLQAPLEDRYLMSHDELIGRIRVLMGGRAAEEIVFGQVSTGASDDIEKASRIARDMLTVYGMSRKLPNLSLVSRATPSFLGQEPPPIPHSVEIEQWIGEEQLEILRRCYEEAKQFLTEKRALLETLTQRLLKQEKIDAHDLLEVLGPRPVGQGAATNPCADSPWAPSDGSSTAPRNV
jgi:cell division protease FtsH